MKFESTTHPDVKLITPTSFDDARGFFMETWHSRKFSDAGIDASFVQENFSSSMKGALRGLHYQISRPQGKLVRVVRGEVYDVAVDIRKSSENFGVWVAARLSESNRNQLWVPPGFAHGFFVLSERADFEYKCTDFYAPEFERSIVWNDPDLKIEWPLAAGVEPLLSLKDAQAPLLKNADVYG